MKRLPLDSPFGFLTLVERGGKIVALEWGGRASGKPGAVLVEAKRQLEQYFARKRTHFDLPLAPDGSDDEKRLWTRMTKIPYGQTATYGELARELGQMPRALGQGCGRNPIPIIIPCHRVVSADGALTGYSAPGGVETKRRLLQFEGALLL
ncbi:MAG: methylated-DNA--[protein]-cysteine S-methyltransferase [Alphaproteobacteria bacterium]|nr:methylated-DNA--[protein]-cysteine S-methyltransferase [Alphaproteobacteria bacterium]MDE1929994.1 methylated-DNA--[protein]-cysteine S-methyltransferase [Alphaproteobacteria bacterium]